MIFHKNETIITELKNKLHYCLPYAEINGWFYRYNEESATGNE